MFLTNNYICAGKGREKYPSLALHWRRVPRCRCVIYNSVCSATRIKARRGRDANPQCSLLSSRARRCRLTLNLRFAAPAAHMHADHQTLLRCKMRFLSLGTFLGHCLNLRIFNLSAFPCIFPTQNDNHRCFNAEMPAFPNVFHYSCIPLYESCGFIKITFESHTRTGQRENR